MSFSANIRYRISEPLILGLNIEYMRKADFITEITLRGSSGLKNVKLNEGYKLFNVISISALYGYGIKALFSTDWLFLGTLGVGFLINHTLAYANLTNLLRQENYYKLPFKHTHVLISAFCII